MAIAERIWANKLSTPETFIIHLPTFGDCTISVSNAGAALEKPWYSPAFRNTVPDMCGDNAQYEVMDQQTGNSGG
jgi:hypothetical protein